MTVSQARLREVLGHFVTGVTVVTAKEHGVPVGFTCQAFASLSLEPPAIVLAAAKSSTSWPRIVRAGTFCVNILSESQEAISRSFSLSGGDKFANVCWHEGTSGVPVLEGALAWAECALGSVHDAGDHDLVIGHVLDLGVAPTGGKPLLFYRGEYGRFES